MVATNNALVGAMVKKVTVHWIDAALEDGDLSPDAAQDLLPLIRESTGYLVEDNAEKVVICFGLIQNPMNELLAYDKPMVIPRAMVSEIEEIK